MIQARFETPLAARYPRAGDLSFTRLLGMVRESGRVGAQWGRSAAAIGDGSARVEKAGALHGLDVGGKASNQQVSRHP